MPSSGYIANSFVANEQPSTAKWNELWGNDASFNSGAGFNDDILVARHFSANAVLSAALGLSSGFANGVESYTANGTNVSNCTGYYLNLGGLKLCWGITGTISVSGSNYQNVSCTLGMPSSFFSSIESVLLGVESAANTQYMGVAGNSAVPATIDFFVNQLGNGSNGGAAISWLVVGT